MFTMKKTNRLLALILSVLLAFAAAGCGSGGGEQPETDDKASVSEKDASDAPQNEEYPYYGKDLGGKTLKIYNVKKKLWDMICVIDPDEITGDKVNDAIYNRNALVEKKLNCQIEEINEETWADMPGRMQKAIAADDGEFDAAYMKMDVIGTGIAQGYYRNLRDISTLHLDEKWWDSILINSTSIEGKNYFATSPAHLMSWDSLWCLFFNETMMENLNLEKPYQLVRDGKWTLDRLAEYCEASANLNGDEKFKLTDYNVGNCVWGAVSFESVVPKFIFGFNVDFATKDSDDMPVFGCDEKFVNACQKLAEFFAHDGYFLKGSSMITNSNYSLFFENQRALFLGAEIKAAQGLRDAEWNFGIVPYPKLDETQENYRSTAVHQVACFTIPACSRNAEDVGLLIDALSFESDKNILGTYFTNVVEQKGLRNDESVEMLNIIKKTRSFDVGIAYQWFGDLDTALQTSLVAGKTDVASQIEKQKPKIEEKISKMLDAIQ